MENKNEPSGMIATGGAGHPAIRGDGPQERTAE